jgi:hypothetical protein
MKKNLLFLIVITAFSVIESFAQTATANLSITLSDVFNVAISGAPVITFDSEEKYENGASAEVDNHLEVLSSRKYKITVNAGTITGPSSIDANSVTVKAAQATDGGNYTGISTYPLVTLGTTAADLITSGESSFDATHTRTKFKVTYSAGADKAYVGKTTSATANIIPVVYTIVQQ